jgi:glycosyltransferase involved in cell wall biosynthesis
VPAALVLVRNDVSHDSRVLREARVLRDLGYDVLVAGVVSATERETELELDGVRVVRLVGPRQLGRRLLQRTDRSPEPLAAATRGSDAASTARHGRLQRFLVTLAVNLQGFALAWRLAPALVHANDYDTMWIGVAAKLLRRSRLVYDAHELWPDRAGDSAWRPWVLACEFLFLRLADAAVTVSPGLADVIAARHRVPKPVVVRNVPEQRLELDPSPPPGPPVAVYSGGLAPGRGIEEALRALPAVPEVRLRLIGPDADGFAAHIRGEADAIGVADRLEILPPVPPADVPTALAGAQIGLALIQPTVLNNRLSLPNKLFEYVVAGVPVLASDLPVLGRTVREEGIGEVVPPGDVPAIAAAMRRLAEPDRNAEARARVRSFAERVNWQRERLVLEGVYRAATARRRATAAS